MSGAEMDNDEPLPRWMQIVAGAVCIVSMAGSLAIILTFACVKDLRSKARELLVHVSLMDLMYTTANLVGLALPYHKYLFPISTANDTEFRYHPHHDTYWRVCQIQAFFAAYGTIGSVLWTMALAVYLYYRVVARDATVTRRLVKVLYVVCYVLPLYVSLWLLLGNHLGYSYNATSGAGWCFVNDGVNGLVLLMTYDIWLWLCVIILIPLYLTTHIHTKLELNKHYLMSQSPSGIIKAERKLLLVPLVFIFLRIWDIVGDTLIVYKHHHVHDYNWHNWIKLFTAIGDCGQGLFNFIIFFLFQQRLRTLMIKYICHYCCCCCNKLRRGRRRRPSYLPANEEEEDDVEDSDQLRAPGDLLFTQHTPH